MDTIDFVQGIMHLLRQGRFDDARAFLSTGETPGTQRYDYWAASILLRQGRVEEAESILRRRLQDGSAGIGIVLKAIVLAVEHDRPYLLPELEGRCAAFQEELSAKWLFLAKAFFSAIPVEGGFPFDVDDGLLSSFRRSDFIAFCKHPRG